MARVACVFRAVRRRGRQAGGARAAFEGILVACRFSCACCRPRGTTTQDAVRSERFAEAARLKEALATLEDGDAVARTQQQLQAALSEERYGDAAELRDGGLASLHGWWAGRAGDDDPVGHILHVTPEYSRWEG